jgi:hypothetical protein
MYFGWPYIEAILILLPIPDPSEIIENSKTALFGLKDKVTGMTSGS